VTFVWKVNFAKLQYYLNLSIVYYIPPVYYNLREGGQRTGYFDFSFEWLYFHIFLLVLQVSSEMVEVFGLGCAG
jgi:hypothetical protein